MNTHNVLVLAGSAGSGKTKIGTLIGDQGLSKRSQWIVEEKDFLTGLMRETARKLLCTAGQLNEQGNLREEPEEELRQASYDQMSIVLGSHILTASRSSRVLNVCLIAPFEDQLDSIGKWRQNFEDTLSNASVYGWQTKLAFAWLTCTPDYRRHRLETTRSDAERGKLEDWDNYCAKVAAFEQRLPKEVARIDTTYRSLTNIRFDISVAMDGGRILPKGDPARLPQILQDHLHL